MKRRTLIGGAFLGSAAAGSAASQSPETDRNDVAALRREMRGVESRTFADILSARPDTSDHAVGRTLGAMAGAFQVVDQGGDIVTASGLRLRDTGLSPVTITVGARGDFRTLNDALWAAQKMRRSYRSKGVGVEVRQLADFVMQEQVFVVQDDLSFITLTAEAPEVRIRRAALSEGNGRPTTNNWRTGTFPAFCAMRGGALPFIRTLYAMDDSGDGQGTVGVHVFENARAVVARGCGVKNAGWRGAYIDAGFFYARASIWSNSGHAGGPEGAAAGVRGSNQAVLMIRQVDATGCRDGAYLSDCIANVSDADFSDAANIGLGVHANAEVYGGGVSADRCGLRGFHVTRGGRFVSGPSSADRNIYTSARDCEQNAALVADGGEMVVEKATLTSTSDHAVEVINAAARLNGATITSAKGRGVNAAENAQVGVMGATISSGEDWGVRTFNGSTLNACNARIQGPRGDVQLNGGSVANLAQATRMDGRSAIVANVLGGEYSPHGEVLGVDQRVEIRNEAEDFEIGPHSRPHQIVSAHLTTPIKVALFPSDLAPHKRITISNAGNIHNIKVFKSKNFSEIILEIAPGESFQLTPTGNNEWI